MKTPRWILYLAIVCINILRFAISALMFKNLFYFRMVNAACLFMSFLILDSVESSMVFYRRRIWSKPALWAVHFNNSVCLFVAVSGVCLRLPLAVFLNEFNINLTHGYPLEAWILVSVTAFLIVLYSWAMQSSWGNIQNLAARGAFLAYCLWYVPWWTSALCGLGFFCLFAAEIVKYGWNFKELRKKDLRFKKQSPLW